MKKSIKKLRKFFRLEAQRGYDNKAVMGGLANILSSWEMEAREDGLPEHLIQAVGSRLRDYHQLSEDSRKTALQGIWQRVQKTTEKTTQLPRESAPQAQIEGEATLEEPEEAAPEPAPAPTKPPSQPTPKKTSGIDLEEPVNKIKGIGPKRSAALERLGVRTLMDLMYLFPRRHDDYSKLKPIDKLWYGEEVTVIGSVKDVSTRVVRGGRMKIVEAVISDKSGSLRVTWFNQPWIANQLSRARQVVLSGEIDQYLGRLTMNNPDWEPLSADLLHTNRIVPVYPLTKDLTQKWLRTKMYKTVQTLSPLLEDPLPEELREKAGLVDLTTAIQNIHFPVSEKALQAAKERLAFDEIFLLQMGVLRQKMAWESRHGRVFTVSDEWLETQLAALPYQLTGAQEKALHHIRRDLASGVPMNRLLQGDVGSGKTVLAAMAILIIVHNGAQAALMSPTSILAEQHLLSLKEILLAEGSLLAEDDVRLLIGSTPEGEKNSIREGLESGEVKVVIGTHALLEDPVNFKDLQLAVIDEQHRFGVEQRGTLRNKGENPHLMVMTATPIPRSLALTIYGDLDISVIDEMPPGRQPVETHVLYPQERERAYTLIRGQLDEGNQAFIIYPLVEESDKSEEKAAVEEHSRLSEEVFPDYDVGLLHGRLLPHQKEAVMERFRNKEIQILVSTTVVEVGVDIPNATIMLVEGAHRFGLAQLHQLRGRVGRGDEKAYCLLIPGSKEGIENERLQVMANTNDGFELAERDLEQRGPGQFLGTRQSGYSELRMAEITDVRLIEKARHFAGEVFQEDPHLSQEKHLLLKKAMAKFWMEETVADIS
ncbi:MAG: ATP-dependent DNA helicase RecG [Anaerolineales bacterium]